jgi:hypothetical protein
MAQMVGRELDLKAVDVRPNGGAITPALAMMASNR